MINKRFTFLVLCAIFWIRSEVEADDSCMFVCQTKNCTHGYLPSGCPRCQCAPDPCMFTSCPIGFRCQPQRGSCPNAVYCPDIATCVADNYKGEQPCGCTDPFNPVCSINNLNYPNECVMTCSGNIKAKEGFCHCNCPQLYQPVCGQDAKTYENECFRDCAGVVKSHNGLCPCTCSMTSNPVCGKDGKTYINECVMSCAGVPKASDGSCECLSLCNPNLYMPVCGADGLTYYNDCYRQCRGIGKLSNFACPWSRKRGLRK